MYTTLLLPFSSRKETVHPGDYYLSFLMYAAVEYIVGVLTGIQTSVSKPHSDFKMKNMT